MANNILIGFNSKEANSTASFEEMGLDDTKVHIVFETGGTVLKSWKPGRSINSINGITQGKGYFLNSKVNMDLTNYFGETLASFSDEEFSTT